MKIMMGSSKPHTHTRTHTRTHTHTHTVIALPRVQIKSTTTRYCGSNNRNKYAVIDG